MILSDAEIKNALRDKRIVIEPLYPDTVRENGVDLRFGKEFCITRRIDAVLDTRYIGYTELKRYYECVRVGDEGFVIPPGRRVLATTEEFVRLPEDIVGLVNLRSSFARLGLYIPPTVADAGFAGELTIEIVGSDFPVRVYPGQRFLHLVFVKTGRRVEKPYNGSYQFQRGVRLPKLPL